MPGAAVMTSQTEFGKFVEQSEPGAVVQAVLASTDSRAVKAKAVRKIMSIDYSVTDLATNRREYFFLIFVCLIQKKKIKL